MIRIGDDGYRTIRVQAATAKRLKEIKRLMSDKGQPHLTLTELVEKAMDLLVFDDSKRDARIELGLSSIPNVREKVDLFTKMADTLIKLGDVEAPTARERLVLEYREFQKDLVALRRKDPKS